MKAKENGIIAIIHSSRYYLLIRQKPTTTTNLKNLAMERYDLDNLKILITAPPDNKIVLITLVMMMTYGEHKNGFIGFMTLSFGCTEISMLLLVWYICEK